MGYALDIASEHDQSTVRARELVNIGHRGASAHAPEHTIAAYDLALAEGAHYLEVDVHTTLDGIPIVLHDTSVDRTGRLAHRPGSGVVSSMTLQELRTLDVGSWFAESRGGRSTFDGLHILTLDEVFDRYRHCARFCIDIKSVDTGGGTEREVLR
jgi:glycerophosphoryl diester phosphodiesterase